MGNEMALSEEVYQLMSSDDYAAALGVLSGVPELVRQDEELLIAQGHCQYELRMDVEALRSYLSHLRTFPNSDQSESAMFNSALCLKNLGLHEEARQLLQKIPPQYERLGEELEHSSQAIERRNTARTLLREMSFPV